jgi:hypothetical protein
MNKLPSEQRAHALQMMVEGVSLRSITRLTGISRTTLQKLLEDAGEAFSEYQDRTLMNLPCKRLQVDEAWAFCYAKQKNVPTAKAAPKGAGDIWTWVGLDAESKLAVSWYVGGRDSEAAMIFMDDLAKRLANRVQLTSDGHKAYLEAVEGAFGSNIDYAMLVKVYGPAPEGQRRYSPAEFVGAVKHRIEVKPDPKQSHFRERSIVCNCQSILANGHQRQSNSSNFGRASGAPMIRHKTKSDIRRILGAH